MRNFFISKFCLKQAVHTSQDSTNFLYCLIKTRRVNRFAQIEIIKTLSDEITELFNFRYSLFCLLLLVRAPPHSSCFCSMNSCKFCKQKTSDNVTIKIKYRNGTKQKAEMCTVQARRGAEESNNITMTLINCAHFYQCIYSWKCLCDCVCVCPSISIYTHV